MKHYPFILLMSLGCITNAWSTDLEDSFIAQTTYSQNSLSEPTSNAPTYTQTIEDSNPYGDHFLNETDPAHAPATTQDTTDDFQKKFMNMLLMLTFLIGLMIAASWFLKRMMRTRATQLNTSSAIKVLESRYLSPRSTLYLIDIQGKGVVIAESATGITNLGEVSLEEASPVSRFKDYEARGQSKAEN